MKNNNLCIKWWNLKYAQRHDILVNLKIKIFIGKYREAEVNIINVTNNLVYVKQSFICLRYDIHGGNSVYISIYCKG